MQRIKEKREKTKEEKNWEEIQPTEQHNLQIILKISWFDNY